MDDPRDDGRPRTAETRARLAHDLTLSDELSGATRAVREFETRWRQRCGTRYAMTTASGSAALLCAYFGLGVGPGDEVICPTYTWINSIGPALLLGARPVFCESDPETLLLDPEDVRRKITPNTRAIVAVHLWGQVCDMDALMAISRESGIPLVEDCSQAHGATHAGRLAGTIGAAGCWSLQGSKAVSAGEGGVLATNDQVVFERACLVSQGSRLGALSHPEHAEHQPLGLGMKLRGHPLGIAIAGVELARLREWNERRRAWVDALERGLDGVAGLRVVRRHSGTDHVVYLEHPFVHLPEEYEGIPTAKLIAALNDSGIAAAPAGGMPLLHRLPLFATGYDLFTRNRGPLGAEYRGYREDDFPATEAMHRRILLFAVPERGSANDATDLADRVRGVAKKLSAGGR